MIEHILYINLDHRTERRESIENVLSGFSYERISAIKHDIGSIGASMSHIKALEYAIDKNWNHVLIMEDDMKWNNFEVNYNKLKTLMKSPYDVILLAGILVSYDPQTSKVQQSNCAGAYLVSRYYYIKLLQNFKQGLDKLTRKLLYSPRIWENKNSPTHYYHIDTHWHKLQREDRWFIVPLCYSEDNYSDSENKFIEWKKHFLT
jgi:hypothetical protein